MAQQRTWIRVGLAVVVAIAMYGAGTTWAANPLGVAGDRELATVIVGQDGAGDVERKLGHGACLVPSASGETTSYLYNVHGDGMDGRYYLRLEVNGQVDAITLSQDPPLSGVCYAPVAHTVQLKTPKGIGIGATQDEVVRVYGKPTESFTVGPMARYRYVAMLDRAYEWDLVFRNGKLVEWTVVTQE